MPSKFGRTPGPVALVGSSFFSGGVAKLAPFGTGNVSAVCCESA